MINDDLLKKTFDELNIGESLFLTKRNEFPVAVLIRMDNLFDSCGDVEIKFIDLPPCNERVPHPPAIMNHFYLPCDESSHLNRNLRLIRSYSKIKGEALKEAIFSKEQIEELDGVQREILGK